MPMTKKTKRAVVVNEKEEVRILSVSPSKNLFNAHGLILSHGEFSPPQKKKATKTKEREEELVTPCSVKTPQRSITFRQLSKV